MATPRPYTKHGLGTLKSAATKLGSRAIDGRSAAGRALAEWRRDLVADLGGEENISTQQAALIELAIKSKLIVDSVDAWLLQQKSLVNHRKRSLFPVVRERASLATSLQSVLRDLGLKRVLPPQRMPWDEIDDGAKPDASEASATEKTAT